MTVSDMAGKDVSVYTSREFHRSDHQAGAGEENLVFFKRRSRLWAAGLYPWSWTCATTKASREWWRLLPHRPDTFGGRGDFDGGD